MAKHRNELPYLPYPRQDVTQVINQHRFATTGGGFDPLATWGNFDGVDDYIGITSDNVVDAFRDGYWSVSAWLQHNTQRNDTPFAVGDGLDPNRHILFLTNAGKLQMNHRGSNTGSKFQTSESVIDLTNFRHVVWLMDAAGTRLYVDGVVQTLNGISGGEINNQGTYTSDKLDRLAIGAYWHSSTVLHWDGQVSDVRVYDSALTAAEVAYLYSVGSSGTDPGTASLEAHYKFGEGSGTTVGDSSGNGNDGVAVNIDEVTFWNP